MDESPADMALRMRSLLPKGWFSDSSSVLDQLLQAIGTAWTLLYQLIQFTRLQTRIATATGSFLDMISADFFGYRLPRLDLELDGAFAVRIKNELLRPRGTRAAVIEALQELTGRAPTIFEPRLSSDTGGYSLGGVGYGVAGGWGNMALPYQMFITVYRPAGTGLGIFAGYGTGGVPVYGDILMETLQLSDNGILAAIPPLLPVATIAWTRISN